MNLADFDYQLSEELIAQAPPSDRAGGRMLVIDRRSGRWEDRLFRDFPEYLHAGDCLVLNDSRVFPARLFGHRAGLHALPVGKNNPRRREFLSGEVEVFLLRAVSADGRDWEALVRPGRKLPAGERIRFTPDLEAEIVARGEFGARTIRFVGSSDLFAEFEKIGHVPLPPYIKRPDAAADRERYQTVFAREKGSVAAPTAGLHFTDEILDACRVRGAAVAYVTLHVGLGTFQPLHTERVEDAHLHTERYSITEPNAALMSSAARLVAVGTTSVRAIESALAAGAANPDASRDREGAVPVRRMFPPGQAARFDAIGIPLANARGSDQSRERKRALPADGTTSSGQNTTAETDIFIYTGYEFRAAGAMLTNFHLPRTSLLLLVCAFAGTELALAAYRHAVEQRYRFYSYGDCMLIV
ncbi:MAG: S-adenosylmethionine:tRNA ribosyltransferase-isomerase [Bryobacteraceae bacterium]